MACRSRPPECASLTGRHLPGSALVSPHSVAMMKSRQLQAADAGRDSWQKMQEALTSGNLTPMIYVAHALKGTLAMFGALPGVGLAQRIEALANAHDATDLAALLQALTVEVHQLVAALRRARPATL